MQKNFISVVAEQQPQDLADLLPLPGHPAVLAVVLVSVLFVDEGQLVQRDGTPFPQAGPQLLDADHGLGVQLGEIGPPVVATAAPAFDEFLVRRPRGYEDTEPSTGKAN